MIKKITQPFKNLFGTIAQSGNVLMYGLIIILVILGPILFMPVYGMPVSVGKGLLIFIMVTIGLLVAGISILKKGSVSLPRHPLFLILGGIVLAQLLGAILSPSFSMSLIGYGYETTTWAFTVIFALIVLFTYKTIDSYNRIGIVYGGILISFVLVFIVQAIRFFAGPNVLTLGVLGSNTSSLVGSWSDLGIFFAMVLLFSTVTLQLAGLKKIVKWIVAVLGTLAAIALLVMNMSILWILLGFISLIFVLYLFAFAYWDSSAKVYKKENRVPWYILSLFVLSIVGIFFGGLLNSFVSRHQNIAWNDIRPSFISTIHAGGKALAHNPVTGYGPNQFSLAWSLAKPVNLSGSPVATKDFTFGFSYFTTQAATNGILSLILWVGFFLVLGYGMIKRLSKGFESSLERYFFVSLAMIIVFITLISWMYVPGIYVLILLAISIGAFLRISTQTSTVPLSFIKDPRASFFGIFGVTVLILGTLVSGYIGIRKLSSFVQDTRGITLLGKGDTKNGLARITQAANLAAHDTYHAQLAQLALSDAGRLLGTINGSNKEAVSKQTEQILGVALGHAKAATELNPSSSANWTLLGNVYQSAVSFGVTEAYALAQTAYAQATKVNPNDSTLILSLANLSLANKDTAGALTQIQNSITQYPTKDAYLLRAQIQIQQQEWSAAVDTLKQVVIFDASNPIAYVYLGVAYERSGDMDNANKIYTLIRNQFNDGDDVIARVKTILAAPQPVTVPETPVVPVIQKARVSPKLPVAPKSKK